MTPTNINSLVDTPAEGVSGSDAADLAANTDPALLSIGLPDPRKLLLDWNSTSIPSPINLCLHHLFERQAERTPDQTAVVFEQQRLTYSELNRRADQLAHRLRELGVAPEVPVGLFVERSLDIVVGILGILKAGGAYVPMDWTFPQERIAWILADAQIPLVLTHSALQSQLPDAVIRTILLDQFDWNPANVQTQSPVELDSSNLAYVIYTSGSTGAPKGVCIEHGSIVNYVLGISERLQLAPGMNHATVSTIAADLGNTVIFPALATGGCLHIISRGRAESQAELSDYFEREHIDVLKIVPSHLAALQTGKEPERVLPKQRLILGGEASRREWIESLRKLAPNCEIFNHYGPTETTVGVLTYHVTEPLPDTASGTLPLGRPLPNIRAYILDQNGEPAPTGVAGEIFIAGDGLARGYLNREDLTAERFIPDPFSSHRDARIYRTGDLGRYLPSGDVEFLGRVDHQVKIRGYRVELGEIESTLLDHPGVREAVVTAIEDPSGTKQLVAYLVPKHSKQPLWTNKAAYILPDGSAVAHLNKNETDYIYNELFVLQAYMRHGIAIEDGDRIVDAGANIGMFTVFANRLARNLKVLSFEPNPAAFACLRVNAEAWGEDVKCFSFGLSCDNTAAEMMVFERMSLLSGFRADPETERDVVRTYAVNQQSGSEVTEPFSSDIGDILEHHFQSKSHSAQLKTLSSVIAEEDLDRIDLLKINVEKSELDVLNGIASADWRKIRQLAIEVDRNEYLAPIVTLLEQQGYEVAVEQDPLLRNTELYYVYAIRPTVNGNTLLREEPAGSHVRSFRRDAEKGLTPGTMRKYLNDRLPQYMVPAAFVLLDKLPLNANGKIDRNALPAPTHDGTQPVQDALQPRTDAEKALAAIWKELLKLESVSIHDDFFELGGNSLLAIKATSRMRDEFGINLSVQTLFENSTIASLMGIVAQPQEETAVAPQRIEPRGSGGPAPLSFAQQPLWYAHQLNPESPVYNIVDVVRIEGTYDGQALRQAVDELVSRHEILRTWFADEIDEPVQFVEPELELPISERDLSTLPHAERERAWMDLVHEDARKPFLLSQPPLLRLTAAHWSKYEHRLLMTIHHIIADEWSMEVIQREIHQLYGAFSQQQSSPLTKLSIQYADFACWQQNAQNREEMEDHLAYWKRELAGAQTVLELPTDNLRPAAQSFRGATEMFSLPSDLLASLKRLSQQEHATLFVTLEASFAALLHRYTEQNDLLVGTPVSRRTLTETQNLIGCFLNIAVLRSQFTPNQNFRSLLRQTRDRTVAALEHTDVSVDRLVAEVGPVRDASRSPLYQVLFVLHDAGGVSQVSKVSGNHALGTGTSKFDLTLMLSENGDNLEGLFEYSTDLFAPATIRRMCGHYATLLQALVRDPEQSIDELPMLTQAERTQLLVEWNSTSMEYPRDLCLHELLEKRAQRSPDRTALVYENQSISYGELNARANQLAHHLQTFGVGPDVLVGILVERSLDMVIGVLGILKAGGAYVPLDPGFPQNRLNYMIEDSGMRVLLTHRDLVKEFSSLPPIVVRMDSDWNEIARNSTESSELPHLAQDNLAYVLYTSGSTGKPKGVAIPHSAIVNFLVSMQSAPGCSETDTLLAVTTLSFDIAALELYLPLLSGGAVVVASSADTHDPRRLIERIRQSDCTIMQATPATYRALVQAEWTGNRDLKLLCGGEPLAPDLTTELLPLCAELWNMYGPTETTVWSTTHRITSSEVPVTIGKPIANTQIYVLDSHRNLVAPGAIGELYIGGEGLARGYLYRDDLTRERFVPSPFSHGARIYRTGDLARWRSDGTLECLGRVDNQVKIRGFRIELGEIETVLHSHPQIADCAVVARVESAVDKQLVAFFKPKSGGMPSLDDLRAHLEKELPPYMIPAKFIPLERLPLTPNGKIDRNALPADATNLSAADSHAQPHDVLEQMLSQIWSRILKVKQIGVDDNFFAIGGHSLLAVRLMTEVERLFHVRLPLATLVEAPTIADLAKVLRKNHWTPAWSSLVPIRTTGSRPPLFLMHSHGGNTLEYQLLADLLDSDLPVYALQARGLSGRIIENSTIQEMASAYLQELRMIQPHGPYFLGGYCFGGLLALEAAQQLTTAGEQVGLVVLIQSINPQTTHFDTALSFLQRCWYRASWRFGLEREYLSVRGLSYFKERLIFDWHRVQARAAISLGRTRTEGNGDLSRLPVHVILEALADEHGNAAAKYVPRPYQGDVVLFRVEKQLRGMVAGEHLGWKEILTGNLDVVDIPGHQQNLLHQPNISCLARELNGRLTAVQKQIVREPLQWLAVDDEIAC